MLDINMTNTIKTMKADHKADINTTKAEMKNDYTKYVTSDTFYHNLVKNQVYIDSFNLMCNERVKT